MFNVEGLKTSSSTSVPFVRDLIEEKNLLLLVLTETWLREHLNAELSVPDFTIYRVDRSRVKKNRGRNSGGVAIYVANSIANSPEVLLEYSSGVIEALCLKIKCMHLIVCAVYRQPDDLTGGNRCTSLEFSQLLESLSSVLEAESAPTPSILIAGDFNLPHTNWPIFEPKPGAPADERRMIELLSSFSSKHFLMQLIDLPTHRAGNTLDLLLTNDPDLFPSQTIDPASPISSHHIITSEFMLMSSGQKPACYKTEPVGFEKINLFNEKTNWDTIKTQLSMIDWDQKFNGLSVTQMVLEFTKVCENIALPNAPPKKKRGRRKPIPRERKILMRKRTNLRKRYQIANTISRRSSIQNKLVEIERKLQESYKVEEKREEDRAVEAIKSNPKYFYSFASRNRKTHSNIGPLEDADGNHTSDQKVMANILSSQYKSAFSTPTQNHGAHTTPPPTVLSDVEFNENQITAAIDEISSNSAAGPDRFPAIFLKKCKEEVSKPIYLIWRKSLDTGDIPDFLKISNITPIHKGGSRQLAKNYRPVALTSHLIKIFEKIVRRHMVYYIENQGLNNPNQHGFRSGYSCLSQLLQHHDRISKFLEEGSCVDVIYLDFAKAFDKLDFLLTILKLQEIGITGKILQWIKSFLTHRRQCVIV